LPQIGKSSASITAAQKELEKAIANQPFTDRLIEGFGKHFKPGVKPEDVMTTTKKLEDQAKRASVWQSTYFHDAYARRQEDYRKVAPTRERDPAIKDKLTRAKAFPIDSMLKFNHSGSTTCLWHSESEPSLHLYKDQNKCWCFGGCGRGYDAIDVYQKLHNCSFIEAVEALQ
jgi:hypothetical protein